MFQQGHVIAWNKNVIDIGGYMWSDFIYLKIYTKKNKIVSSGIDFHEFTEALGYCDNYLILAGEPINSEFNTDLFLEYVSGDNRKEFVSEDVENWGDFCWVNFVDQNVLKCVKKEELAELLYMCHMKNPLNSYKIKTINNTIAYLCHDDGIWNTIYMDDVEQYKKIVGYIIEKFSYCKIIINQNDQDENLEFIKDRINNIYELMKKGLILDFRNVVEGYINLYVTESDIDNLDKLEDMVELFRKKYTSGKKSKS